MDGFGIKWEYPSTGGGAAVPDVNYTIMDDVTEWREKVTIPDPAKYDWKADYEMECRMIGAPDRENSVIDFGFGNGVFERLAALMGFEDALIAMAMEPEETYALMEAEQMTRQPIRSRSCPLRLLPLRVKWLSRRLNAVWIRTENTIRDIASLVSVMSILLIRSFWLPANK